MDFLQKVVLSVFVLGGFVFAQAEAGVDCAAVWKKEMADSVAVHAEGLYMRYGRGEWSHLGQNDSIALPEPGTPCLVFRIGQGNPFKADGGIFVVKVERFYADEKDPEYVKKSVYLDRNATPTKKKRWADDVYRHNYTNYHNDAVYNRKLKNGFHTKLIWLGDVYRTDASSLRPSFRFHTDDETVSRRSVFMMHYKRPDTEQPTDIPFYFGREESEVSVVVELVNLGDLTSGIVPSLKYEFGGG